ncbi:MAG: hypothetical protein IJA93_07850 [Clostridia bacterium]|nr:hypothetical protein [Clostridia bacterium]
MPFQSGFLIQKHYENQSFLSNTAFSDCDHPLFVGMSVFDHNRRRCVQHSCCDADAHSDTHAFADPNTNAHTYPNADTLADAHAFSDTHRQ